MADAPVLAREDIRYATFDGLWPHKPRFATTPDGHQAHYVSVGDERARSTVVAVHGNPTWGFMYRHLIDAVSSEARVVVPDLVGYGKSDAVTRSSWYALDRHLRGLTATLDDANVENVTLVLHDWGGPIGLAWAAHNADKVAGIVLLNTWAFAPKRAVRLHPFLQALRAPLVGAVLVQTLGLAVDVGIPHGVVHKGRLTKEVMAAYKAPFPTSKHRAALRAAPQLVPDDPDHPSADFFVHVEEGLAGLTCPVRIVWGQKDPVFPRTVPEIFQRRLPNVEDVTRIEDAGHFVAEDAPEAVAKATRALLG